MLGMVFTELIEMVETEFSVQMADAIVQDSGLAHGGAYTAVGYYDHQELMALVQALSARSGLGVDTLVRRFGHHLMSRFALGYPTFFAGGQGLFEFLVSVDSRIHVEVRKLYPEARLPRFELVACDARSLVLRYQSPRHMVALALGLIEGAVDHFKEPCRVWSEPVPESTDFLLHVQREAR